MGNLTSNFGLDISVPPPATPPVTMSDGGHKDTIVTSNPDVANAISSLANELRIATEQLISTLSSLSDSVTFTQVFFAIFITFIGSFSAYLFNHFHWKVVDQKQKVSRIGGALSSLINELESISVDYWVNNYKEEEQQQTHAIEVSIKSKLRLISRYIKLITPKLNSKKALINKQKLEEFEFDIYDLVTGDDFESTDRKASKPKAMKISNQCSDIKAMISSLDFCV